MTDTWTWATVTQASPLRIKVDGDTSALNATTDNLVGSLAVDDRVRVHLHADGIIVTGIQGGGNRSNPNLLINGNFQINQRGYVSGSTFGNYQGGEYGFDRWEATQSGTTLAFTASPQGQLVTLNDGKRQRQLIERENVPAGDYVLSWEGDVTARVSNVGGSASFASSPVLVTLDGTDDVVVEIGSFGGTYPFGNVKMERGTVPTPYQPPTYADNLRACMRYYQRFPALEDITRFGLGVARTSTKSRISVPMLVPMRDSGVTLTYSADLRVTQTGTAPTISSLSVNSRGTSIMYLECAHSTMTGGGVPIELLAGSTGSFIAFDARL